MSSINFRNFSRAVDGKPFEYERARTQQRRARDYVRRLALSIQRDIILHGRGVVLLGRDGQFRRLAPPEQV